MCLFAGGFSAVCLFAGPHRWESVLFGAALGGALRFCLGILPTTIEVTPHVLRWSSGTWKDECSLKSICSIDFDIVRGVLRLRLQLSGQGNRTRSVVLAAPLRYEAPIREMLEPPTAAAEGNLRTPNDPATTPHPIPLEYRPTTTRITGLFPLGLVASGGGIYSLWLDARMAISGRHTPMWFWSFMFGLTAVLLVAGFWGMKRGVRRN
jgi:hypothetical protein